MVKAKTIQLTMWHHYIEKCSVPKNYLVICSLYRYMSFRMPVIISWQFPRQPLHLF